MNVYKRYVSGEHDKHYFEQNQFQKKSHIKLRPLSGQFDVTPSTTNMIRTTEEWLQVFPSAAFFSGYDPVLFGYVVTVVYKNVSTSKISAVSITKFGCNVYENIILDSSSRFWPACDNLTPDHRSSNVRKALAISNLKNFNKLWNNRGIVEFTRPWDETNAGALASAMRLMDGFTPSELGERLLSLGLLQVLSIDSVLIDIIYDNINGGDRITAQNNALVSLLGTQMDQLFDPLLEYSPQSMDYTYVPPLDANSSDPLLKSTLINEIVKEMLMVQTNYTMGLVDILQDLIIPLRVSLLLEVAIDSSPGSVRVNQVFPPTIDEIARINCILHNSLKAAHKYGYNEVFKVMANLLPYFYQAFVRHQANIRKFNQKLLKFLKRNNVFGDTLLNKKSYTAQQVESIITGSVFELPKIKLIVARLYDAVLSEQEKLDVITDNTELEHNYKIILETVDALGFNDEAAELPAKKRIFTPSGRLLLELAKGWPEELVYGWSSRKVLAVYEVCAILSKGRELLVVFTDHLLFLEVAEPTAGTAPIKLADVLMNSLINKVPLPKLSYNPDLRVKYWCNIDRLIVKVFDGVKGKSLSLTTYGGNSFKLRDQIKPTFSLVYDFANQSESAATCSKIMNSITKAQILHKSTAFHLFKHSDKHLNRYYCAHDKLEYQTENMKSAIVIMLNISKKEIDEIFGPNPQVGMILVLSSLNDYTVHIFGYNRQRTYEVKEVVSIENLVDLLKDIVAKGMNSIFHSSFMTKELILSGEKLLEIFYSYQQEKRLEMINNEDSVAKQPTTPDELKRESKIEAFELYSQYPTFKKKSESSEDQTGSDGTLAYSHESKLRRRKSAVFSILLKLKLKKDLEYSAGSMDHDDPDLDNISMPEGKQIIYKRLYKPEPLVHEATPQQLTDEVVVNEELKNHTLDGNLKIETNFSCNKTTNVSSNSAVDHDVKSSPPNDACQESTHTRDPILSLVEQYSLLKDSECSPFVTSGGFVPQHKKSISVGTVIRETAVSVHKGTSEANVDSFKVQEIKPVDVDTRPALVEPTTPKKLVISRSTHSPFGQDALLVEKSREKTPTQCLKIRDFFLSPGSKLKSINKDSHLRSEKAFSRQKMNDRKDSFPPFTAEDEIKHEKIRSVVDEDQGKPERKAPEKRLFSNHDAASALDSMTAVGVSPSVLKKFSAYQNLPNYLLRADGLPNWVLLNGLRAEHASGISASITSNSVGSEKLQNIFYELPSNTLAQYVFDDSFTPVAITRLLLERDAPVVAQVAKPQEISPTSSVIVTEFGRQLDKGFKSGLQVDDLNFTEHDDCSTMYADHELDRSNHNAELKNLNTALLSSPEDECFTPRSSDDFAACAVVSSSCSDMTLRNDIQFESDKTVKSDDFGSLLYLSEAINNTAALF